MIKIVDELKVVSILFLGVVKYRTRSLLVYGLLNHVLPSNRSENYQETYLVELR